jgi:3-oxoacyl-[acyl-carrier protein] reductase
METIQGHAAIITGAGTGIGAATAKKLAALGCNVLINYSRSEKEALATAEACKKLGADSMVYCGDVSNDGACRGMVAETVKKWGRVDALVNNAGVTKFCDQNDLEGLNQDDFIRIFAVNVVGPYQMTRAAVPYMKKRGQGTIINVASNAGITGIASSTAYAASKGALITLTLSLARVLGPEIRVNAVCPGFTESRWNRDGLGEDKYGKVKHFFEESTPLQLVPTTDDIADVILYFICGARVVTGETLLLDGGNHLNQTPLARR